MFRAAAQGPVLLRLDPKRRDPPVRVVMQAPTIPLDEGRRPQAGLRPREEQGPRLIPRGLRDGVASGMNLEEKLVARQAVGSGLDRSRHDLATEPGFGSSPRAVIASGDASDEGVVVVRRPHRVASRSPDRPAQSFFLKPSWDRANPRRS